MQGSNNRSSQKNIFRFTSFSLEAISFFTHRDAVQLSGSYSSNGRKRKATFQMDYPLLNQFLRSKLTNKRSSSLMSHIGASLAGSSPRWECITLHEVLGAPVLLTQLGLISNSNSTSASPVIKGVFSLNEEEKS